VQLVPHPIPPDYRQTLISAGQDCLRARNRISDAKTQLEYEDKFQILELIEKSIRKQFGVPK
jgi:hypothetical protein